MVGTLNLQASDMTH